MRDSGKIIMHSIINKTELCGTCAFWVGSRKIKPDGQIIFHPYSKGVCDGGGFSYATMSAMAACDHWVLWSLIDTSEDFPTEVRETPAST